MVDPWNDFYVFDWVLTLGSTSHAAQSLGVPQSSVSRRFRSFSSEHQLNVQRTSGKFRLTDNFEYVRQMRLLARNFRFRSNRLAVMIQNNTDFEHILRNNYIGLVIALPASEWGKSNNLIGSGQVDLVYSTPDSKFIDGLDLFGAETMAEESNRQTIFSCKKKVKSLYRRISLFNENKKQS